MDIIGVIIIACFVVGVLVVSIWVDYLEHKRHSIDNSDYYGYIAFKEFKSFINDAYKIKNPIAEVPILYTEIYLDKLKIIRCSEIEIHMGNNYMVMISFVDYCKYVWWLHGMKRKAISTLKCEKDPIEWWIDN